MPSIETYRKQAKQLVRWHRERNYSIGAKARLVERYRHLTDIEVLSMPLSLTVAQEVVAIEAGFKNWTDLKASACRVAPPAVVVDAEVTIRSAVPILFVQDVVVAAAFYRDQLGFNVDFLHGDPPFYGSVSRGAARIHLRFVHQPTFFSELAAQEGSLILAAIEVSNAKVLFEEYQARGVLFAQRLTRQAWGGIDFRPLVGTLAHVSVRAPQ